MVTTKLLITKIILQKISCQNMIFKIAPNKKITSYELSKIIKSIYDQLNEHVTVLYFINVMNISVLKFN